MEEEAGYYGPGQPRGYYEEVRRFQTRGEFEQWWETEQRDWGLNGRNDNDDRRFYWCVHQSPNPTGRCPARLRVVIHADGQLHTVSNSPDRPHDHTNPQAVGRIDNLRSPRTTYQEYRRTGLYEHQRWWQSERANWQLVLEPGFDDDEDGWMRSLYRCRGHGERACLTRLCIAFSPLYEEDIVTVAISSIPHNR